MNLLELQRKPQGEPFARRPNRVKGATLPRGLLGDKIARIAQPIARAIDKVTGTKLAKCGGCKKMKERFNAGMPIVKAVKLRLHGR
jgi:hypothetical protein